MLNPSPQSIELGEQRVPGQYFFSDSSELPEWLGEAEPESLLALGDVEYFFTEEQQRLPHIRNTLLAAIGAAKKKVFFCSWIFADDLIVRALCEAAERLHGGVYILTALEKDLRPDRNESDELDPDEIKIAQRRERHIDNLHNLARAGAWLRSVPDCHPKFCVIDDEVAIVTSANATSQAYEENPENGVLLRAPSLARELGRLFAHAWLHLANLESPPGANINAMHLRPGTAPAWRELQPTAPFSVVCTLNNIETSLRDRTVALLDAAEREIIIATYHVVGLEDHPVGQAVRRALRRGVRLLLLMRPNNLLADQCASCGWLLEGMPAESWCVRGHSRTHAKAVVVDGKKALLWTGNLDGYRGYEAGLEVGIEAEHAGFVAAVRRHMIALAARSPLSGVLRPRLAELSGVSGIPWTSDLELLLSQGQAARLPADFVDRLQREVISYWKSAEGRFHLQVGRELTLRASLKSNMLIVEDLVQGPAALQGLRPDGFFGRCKLRIAIRREPERPTHQPRKLGPRNRTRSHAGSAQGRGRR